MFGSLVLSKFWNAHCIYQLTHLTNWAGFSSLGILESKELTHYTYFEIIIAQLKAQDED